jgi:hypothetical protein
VGSEDPSGGVGFSVAFILHLVLVFIVVIGFVRGARAVEFVVRFIVAVVMIARLA